MIAARRFGVVVALIAATWALHLAGAGSLTIPLGSVGELGRWAHDTPAPVMAMALVRLAALGAGGYLGLALGLHTLAHVAGWRRVAVLAARALPAMARRGAARGAQMSLAAGAVLGPVGPVAAGPSALGGQPPRATATMWLLGTDSAQPSVPADAAAATTPARDPGGAAMTPSEGVTAASALPGTVNPTTIPADDARATATMVVLRSDEANAGQDAGPAGGPQSVRADGRNPTPITEQDSMTVGDQSPGPGGEQPMGPGADSGPAPVIDQGAALAAGQDREPASDSGSGGRTQPSMDPGADPSGGYTWVVGAGDSFWSIAEAVLADDPGPAPSGADVGGYWRQLIAANRDRLVAPDHPDLLIPGQVLILPRPS